MGDELKSLFDDESMPSVSDSDDDDQYDQMDIPKDDTVGAEKGNKEGDTTDGKMKKKKKKKKKTRNADDIDPNIRHTTENVEWRYIPSPKPPSDSVIYFVRSKAIAFQHHPFNRDDYKGKDIRPELRQSKLGRDEVKLKPEDVVRWKVENGVKKTNSHIVKFSDGSTYLFIGKDALQITTPSLTVDHHLFIRQKYDKVKDSYFQMHGQMKKKMVFAATEQSLKRTMNENSRINRLLAEGKVSSQLTFGANDPLVEKQVKEELEKSQSSMRTSMSKKQELTAGYLEYDEDSEEEKEQEKKLSRYTQNDSSDESSEVEIVDPGPRKKRRTK
jgi:hypothetical protein